METMSGTLRGRKAGRQETAGQQVCEGQLRRGSQAGRELGRMLGSGTQLRSPCTPSLGTGRPVLVESPHLLCNHRTDT